MTPKAAPAEPKDRKPRRTLTVADHLAARKERVARCENALAEAVADLNAYVADVRAKAEALTAELPKE
jgi:hypothetical protein